jgi:mannose-6-phosphate isomerase class I
MLITATNSQGEKNSRYHEWRSSLQPLLPQRLGDGHRNKDEYRIYPYHSLGGGKIFNGYESLADWIAGQTSVIIDGYNGVLWEEMRDALTALFNDRKLRIDWVDITSCRKDATDINTLIEPFIGLADTLWGKRCDHELMDFFQPDLLSGIKPKTGYDLTIVYGTGSALVNWEYAPIVYMDLPKNEIQYRMKAGAISNLGSDRAERPADMYKRSYFVDWVVLNKHKKQLLNRITIVADAQQLDSINWMTKENLMEGLTSLSTSVFRVRPWFEPGAWGGQWMKERFKGLNKAEANYAWSFELIVPENGLVFESDGYLLELSFDFLMYADNKSILGKHAETFEDEFPIRFDFLDTWEGGNLSIQCHPSLTYIRKMFGEKLTQDETYYILDCKQDAKVYLGFQENIDAARFRETLEKSRDNNEIVTIEEYVQTHPAHKHDLFLIPNGTVHSAGANNLVLEISATPYIFTFKMYDWLRLDLNGEPRAINIEHAFNNLKFERKGELVGKELISTPTLMKEGSGWQLIHLPTHRDHFYDVHRMDFDSVVHMQTDGSCNVLMLVEGTKILVRTKDGRETIFHYAETFVIPAAAQSYTVTNLGEKKARLIKAFIKDNIDQLK